MLSFLTQVPAPLKSLMRTTSSRSSSIESSKSGLQKSNSKKISSRSRTHHVGTARTATVKKYFARINAQDFVGAMTEMCTPDAIYVCSGDCIIGMQELIPEAHTLFAAMPDAIFSSRLIKEVTVVETGKSYVVVYDYVVGGTHTGAPYNFGTYTGAPYNFATYPPIKATGKMAHTDPCQLRVDFDGDKISRITIRKAGRYTGPAGLYTKLGGLPLV